MLELAWLIPALPLAGFLVLAFFGRRIGDPAAGWLATLATGTSFLVTAVVFLGLFDREAEARAFTQRLFTWIPVGGLQVDAALLVDPLSITMALFVTGVGALIHLYSVGYMHDDPGYGRYFAYLNLFTFSMLVLVLADNFLLSFLGWEGVGACSYLLISFWFERQAAATAGKKAFVTNRVGDFGFMIAMFLVFSATGSLRYLDVFGEVEALAEVTATAIALLLFVGAVGKSAQLPLYVWLPDAMEGPTPVSALIHAATMVTAGVYLMVRVNPILDAAPDALTVVAVVGAATAFFAAVIACAQDDIKRVLAYSTISQLGYMFLAVGSGAYVAAVFHMVTHAFFKALLFLGAGSVIHGLHNQQDMKRMGALRKWMPLTAGTFIAGWLAIAGVPPFSGFWSKDEILLGAWEKSPVLWAVGLVTALLTAYYMSRQVMLVFYGRPRWSAEAERVEPHEADEPHEAPPSMAVPLVVLAGLSVVGGLLNLPLLADLLLLEHWLEPVLAHAHHSEVTTGGKVALAAVAAAAALAGVAAGIGLWRRRDERPELEPALVRRGFGVDDAYAALVETPGRALAAWSAYVFDRRVVDGAANGLAAAVRAGGAQLRRAQTGYVRNYALGVAAGTVLVLGWFLARTQL